MITAADCAATLVMFDEMVLRYHVVGHDREVHNTLNLLVTLYGQRERLAARSIVKRSMTREEFETQASEAAAQWLTELSRRIFVAWSLTLVIRGLLEASQGELVTLYGHENLRTAWYVAQTHTPDMCQEFLTTARLAEVDWWTARASGTEMAMAVTCALYSPQQLKTFFNFAPLPDNRLQSTSLDKGERQKPAEDKGEGTDQS
jgi:hypothetical protein